MLFAFIRSLHSSQSEIDLRDAEKETNHTLKECDIEEIPRQNCCDALTNLFESMFAPRGVIAPGSTNSQWTTKLKLD